MDIYQKVWLSGFMFSADYSVAARERLQNMRRAIHRCVHKVMKYNHSGMEFQSASDQWRHSGDNMCVYDDC